MKKRLSRLPAESLLHLGLLIAIVLLLAANGFAAVHPALTAILVFVFSLPYLVASVVTRRARLLYATMLLGAVSYFMACYALGAPTTSFPVLSLPLVGALWVVGQYLRKRLPAELGAYPPTVFRAMNMTVAAFTIWALVQVGSLMAQGGVLAYVAGLALLGYAAMYLLHCAKGAPGLYIYVLLLFLTLGGILTTAAASSAGYCWVAALAAAGGMLLAGAKFHVRRGWVVSRHFFVSSAVAIGVSAVLSAWRWTFLLTDLAVASVLLWLAYCWLVKAVRDASTATMAERVLAKCFFIGSLALTVPAAPAALLAPGNVYVVAVCLLCAATYGWRAYTRRGNVNGRGGYVLAGAMFLSLGLAGMGAAVGPAAMVLAPATALAVLAGLALLAGRSARAGNELYARVLGGAAIFPAFAAWYLPLLGGHVAVSLAGAGLVAAGAALLAALRKQRSFLWAVGPALAGVVVAGLLLGGWEMAWPGCAAAALPAAALFAWAQARGKAALRVAANLAWAILSAAAVVLAGAAETLSPLFFALAAVAATSVLLAGAARRKRDVLNQLVVAAAALATIAAVTVGPFSSLDILVVGLCLLAVAVCYWAGWALGRSPVVAHAANALLALSLLIVDFSWFSAVDARLGAGAAVVGLLFAIAMALRRRFPQASDSSVHVGNLAAMVLAGAALIQAWPLTQTLLPLAAAPFLLIYLLMSRLRPWKSLRVASVLWLSFAGLFLLSGQAGTPYRQQVPLVALLSFLWLAIGFVLRRRTEAWSTPLYVAAAVLAGLCGAVSLFAPAAEHSWLAFLVNGAVFACLFVLLRQDVFVYLLTLSLTLMAYDWVKASTSLFTQDVLFYLVLGAAVLGLFFLLPYVKRLLSGAASLPMFSIFTWRGAAVTAVPILGLSLVVVAAYALKITGHPKFCTSCHYMGDYYSSWQHSSHQNVACIKCHYDPGMAAEVKGKLAGLVQVVKYVSHTYTMKPHALISNGACMREGCHAEMDHSKETLLFHGQIRFRHDKHLAERPRGKVLNCVSCHGQSIAGRHISVSETTCLTCHFYGRGEKPVAVGNCQTCHVLPSQPVTFMGSPFNHREFLAGKGEVQCSHCHSQVTQGDGRISQTRCRACHLHQPGEVKDQAQFHLIHVSKGHFDCLQCHDEIKHGGRRPEQMLAAESCTACHTGQRHSLQERIYSGMAVEGMPAAPDAMYKAGVTCDGCHTDVRKAGPGAMPFTKKFSGPQQCADCHGGESYGKMLTAWQAGTKDRLAELGPALAKLESLCAAAAGPAEEVAKAKSLAASARTKLSYVVQDGSYGAHNAPYILEILDRVEEEISQCRSLTAQWPAAAAAAEAKP